MAKAFIDTNVVVYAHDERDKRKQKIALDLITKQMTAGSGVISTQVLQEYAAVALRKLNQDVYVVLHQLRLLEFFEVVECIPELIRRGIEIYSVYQIHFWDACILSAAESGGCSRIYSADLSAGSVYSGIEVINPFA